MHILFITRSTLYSAPGGDTVQIDSTAKYLRKKGIHVDIKLSNEKNINYPSYDLLHFFNIIRPADILSHVEKSKKPYVISTIFVDYSEYDRFHREGFAGLAGKIFSADTIEYLKAVARMIKNREKINSRTYLFKGHKKSIQYLIKNASCLLPNSQNEYKRLVQKYGIRQRYMVVPNAIDTERFTPCYDVDSDKREGVICVARIEGIKNQLNLIKAFKKLNYNLKLIGKPAPNALSYYNKCKEQAPANVTFVDHMPQEELISILKNARVHILPSWFETTGLSSLEAAVMGCNIVVTAKGDTLEYFGNYALICDPGNPDSIAEQIEKAYTTPYNEEIREYILKNFTWEKAAEKTIEAYYLALGCP